MCVGRLGVSADSPVWLNSQREKVWVVRSVLPALQDSLRLEVPPCVTPGTSPYPLSGEGSNE